MNPSSSSPQEQAPKGHFPAPAWHSALLIAVILAVAVTGMLMTPREAPLPSRPDARTLIVAVYVPMIVVQWGLAFYVCRVARPQGTLRNLLGDPPRGLRDLALLLGLVVLGWVAIHLLDYGWTLLVHAGSNASVDALLPHTLPERLAWGVVATSVGFSEEVVYRGYLQAQLSAATRSAGWGVALQAILFGIAHGEQGGMAMVRLGTYGLLFGLVARWRRSLWPGIVCHVAIDLTSGLVHS